MSDTTEKRGRGRPSQGGREHGKITAYLRPEMLAAIKKLAVAATALKGKEVSVSTVAAHLIEAGFDQVTVEGIVRDSP